MIKKKIDDILKKNGLNIKKINLDLNLEDYFSKKINFYPYTHSLFRLKFNLEQILNKNNKFFDFSGIIIYENKEIGYWPFTYLKEQNKVTSYGFNIFQPIFINNLSIGLKKKIIKNILNSIYEICSVLKIKKFCTEDTFINENLNSISLWHEINLQFTKNRDVNYDLYVDIKKNYSSIKSNYRKSYKSLINQSQKLFEIKTLKKDDYQMYMNFKSLHEHVSGRQTRSNISWDLNFKEIENGNSILIYLMKKNHLLGGSIFNLTPHEAIYGVGVYDRKYFDIPLSHSIQDKAIQIFQKKNINWYKLGDWYQPLKKNINDKKLEDISNFKKGFATNIINRFIFNHII